MKSFAPRGRFIKLSSSLKLLLVIVCCAVAVAGQQKEQKGASNASTVVAQPRLTRTTTRHEVRRLAYGSSITLLGAPAGTITIEAWSRPEVDLTADIELRADTEEDLTRLAALNTFFIDAEPNQLRILTTGTHDKVFMRRAAKDFPKKLLGLPWKIDYHLRVPAFTDLDINNGRGAFHLTGVEGSISFQAQESDAFISAPGGTLRVTLLRGSVKLIATARSWRGVGANVQLAAGDITLELPTGFSGDVDADILRVGQIENNYPELTPREQTTPTPRSIMTRAGAGGAAFALTVGDGAIKIIKTAASDK
ncbi:MAG: hypothetical protein QOF02_2303 [Blastocatellia bacterium]|nr:hypothetical protein [Blastocatellia bacterium]